MFKQVLQQMGIRNCRYTLDVTVHMCCTYSTRPVDIIIVTVQRSESTKLSFS